MVAISKSQVGQFINATVTYSSRTLGPIFKQWTDKNSIRQTKDICVFGFITENSIKKCVLERAAQKLSLDRVVIQQGRQQNFVSFFSFILH